MFLNEFPDFQCVKHIIAPLGFRRLSLFCPDIPLLGKPLRACRRKAISSTFPKWDKGRVVKLKLMFT